MKKGDPISKSLNLRLEDGYNNIMRKVHDPEAQNNKVFALKEVKGRFKPVFAKKKINKVKEKVSNFAKLD